MRRRLLACAALALVSATQPGDATDPDRLYRDGVAARHAGDTGRSVSLLRQVVEAQPDNADAQLQLGLALLAEGRLDEAEAALRRTLAIAPDYQDATDALARLERRRAEPAAELRWRLDVDGSYSALEGPGRRDWQEGAVRLGYKASDDMTVGAAVEVARRFGETDTYGELRIDQRLSDGASVYVSAGGTPNADFRAEWQIGAGGSVRVVEGRNPTVLTLDARQAKYRSGDVQTVSPGAQQYFAGGRVWLTGRWINIFDETGKHRSGFLARADAMATERLRLFAGLADAPDVSEGVVTDTFSLFGGVAYDLDDRTQLRFSIAHEDRETGADRLQMGLGIGFRF